LNLTCQADLSPTAELHRAKPVRLSSLLNQGRTPRSASGLTRFADNVRRSASTLETPATVAWTIVPLFVAAALAASM
jgi:hypothetical protein